MSRSRDIAKILSATEANNTANVRLFQSNEAVGLDSGQVQNVGLQKFTTLDSLPSTGLTSGQQAWVESSGRLYISNGSGWYNIALVNATPTLTLDQSGMIQLNSETLTVTVTASATDSDDNPDIISFSVESDGNMVGTGTTVSQDSSVFTVTALSADSGGTAGTFTLTFKATDQVAVDNEALSFNLRFSNVIDSSAETVLLLKADGNNLTNNAITFEDSNGTTQGWTEGGAPSANTFSPYRPGGYSTNFDGTSDYISFTATSDLSFDSDFTIEGWIYPRTITLDTQHPNLIILGSNTQIYLNSTNDYIALYDGSADAVKSANNSINLHEWNHFAAVRSGTNTAMFLNGSRVATKSSDTTTYGTSSGTQYIGNFNGASGGGDYDGFIRDLRIVKGSAVYNPSNTSYTLPTSGLTAIDGTVLLTCHAPYIGDGSTNVISLASYGQVSTKPFGPYDYEAYDSSVHGGSVHFDGTSDHLDYSDVGDFGTGDFTWESWIYPTVLNAGDNCWIETRSQGTDAGLVLFVDDGYIRTYGGGGYRNAATGNLIRINQWNHVALVRSSGTMTIYENGVAQSTVSYSGNVGTPGGMRIGTRQDNNEDYTGYIADMRLTTDAVYTANFTPPTSPVSANSATLFLMQNKTDANLFDAAQANRARITGDTKSSTSFSKWTGKSSIRMDGNGDRLTIDTDHFGRLSANEPFTLEGWFYLGDNTDVALFHFTDTLGTLNDVFYISGTSNAHFYANGAGVTTNAGGGISLSTWHHLAMTRHTDNKIRIFVDGTLKQTSSGTYTDLVPRYLELGRYGASNGQFNGYMQDIRITKGRARYTASFTAPTAEFEL